MTPQLVARLRIHEGEGAEARPSRRLLSPVGVAELAAVPVSDVAPLVEQGPPRPLVRRETLHRRLLAVADVLSAAFALVVVLNVLGQDRAALMALVGMPLLIIPFKVAGLYDRDELQVVHSTLDEVPRLMQLTALFALGVTILQPVLVDGGLGGAQIAALWLGAFASIVTGRMIARSLAGRISPTERCLVVGEPERAQRVREKLASSRARATVIATLPLGGDDVDGLGDPETIRYLIRTLHVHRIVIAPTTTEAGEIVELIRIAKGAGASVSVLPRMFEAVGSAVEFDDVDGMTMLGVRRFGLSQSSRLLKRAFDLVVTSLAMLVAGPLIAAIALAVRLDSRGRVFFRQVRVGRDGRHFSIVKFRSMVADADAQQERLLALNEAGTGLFKIADDPRVTRVGRFLRRTSLDELPQLLNVLRGEMSLVGPRPLVVHEDALVLGLDRSRLHLTPGMTGPWQVMGARVPMHEMVGIDYLYVANWSLWLDFKILLRTVRHVLRRGNV
jgi:exopolysaccharide biosynthesis polyprenyl glycosylphosphotransferase